MSDGVASAENFNADVYVKADVYKSYRFAYLSVLSANERKHYYTITIATK